MLNKKPVNYLVFTDLDGTLLDHHTYSFEHAQEMLNYLKQQQIPLIIVTSKTKQEILNLRDKLQINYPFIVENGAGIFIPSKEDSKALKQIAMGKTYAQTLSFLNQYKEAFKIKGFFEMSDKEVAQLTGLSIENAQLAKARDFSEPFIIEDEAMIDEFKLLCEKEGFDVIKGGRFYHLITKGQDKANALEKVTKIYEEQDLKNYTSIALGDGANDKTMLNCANIAVLIKQHDGTFIEYEKEDLIKTEPIGPKGWNQALKGILCP